MKQTKWLAVAAAVLHLSSQLGLSMELLAAILTLAVAVAAANTQPTKS